MKSYKNWKLVNESLFPLGLSQPKTVGGLVGNTPIAEAKKKMKGKMHDEDMDEDGDDDHTCSCDKNMKKKMKGEEGKNSKQTPKDHSGEKSWSKEGGKKKKMGDEMEVGPMLKKKKPVDDIEDDEEDVEDDHIEDDEIEGDDEEGEDDDMGGDEEEEGDDEGGDEDQDMAKYGFMKKKMKKMKKKMKKMQEDAAIFEKDIADYPDMPQDHSQDSEKEFFASLARQFGKPNERFQSGLSEDMLVPLNDPNAPNYVAPEEPGPGEVGFAPQGRMGESTEFSTLCKYLGEEAARKLIKSGN